MHHIQRYQAWCQRKNLQGHLAKELQEEMML